MAKQGRIGRRTKSPIISLFAGGAESSLTVDRRPDTPNGYQQGGPEVGPLVFVRPPPHGLLPGIGLIEWGKKLHNTDTGPLK